MASIREARLSTPAGRPTRDGRVLASSRLPRAITQPDGLDPVLQAMPVGVLIEDDAGRSWINAELARVWRYESREPPPPSALRQDLVTRVGRDHSDHRLREAFGSSAGVSPWRLHALRRRDGTTVPVRVMDQALAAADGSVLRATYVMESAPPEPDVHLRRGHLAVMAHELRTPISSIVVGAELLRGAGLNDETRDEVTALVVEEAHRVNILIEQLTALTLLQSPGTAAAAEPVHMVHLVRRVGAREARRRPGIHLALPSLEPARCTALGDEGFVSQVVEILIDNAAKYAGPTGAIEVVVDQAGAEVAVHVLDRGPGLQGTDAARLFDLFERGEVHAGDGRGTGIGLYVAGQIVKAMHGRIWALDRPQGGADFGFALPVAM